MGWKELCSKYTSFDRPEAAGEGPTSGVQWKGTTVCLDFVCLCGFAGHFDGDFAYLIHCPACDRVYWQSGNIRLKELDADEAALAIEENSCIVRPEEN